MERWRRSLWGVDPQAARAALQEIEAACQQRVAAAQEGIRAAWEELDRLEAERKRLEQEVADLAAACQALAEQLAGAGVHALDALAGAAAAHRAEVERLQQEVQAATERRAAHRHLRAQFARELLALIERYQRQLPAPHSQPGAPAAAEGTP